jgi:hypothetical protein
MTVLHHAVSALMASFPHRKRLSRGSEGKPKGADMIWHSQNYAWSCGTEVGREGATLQPVWPVRSRRALVAHAWLFSFDLKKFGALTTLAPSALRKRWAV